MRRNWNQTKQNIRKIAVVSITIECFQPTKIYRSFVQTLRLVRHWLDQFRSTMNFDSVCIAFWMSFLLQMDVHITFQHILYFCIDKHQFCGKVAGKEIMKSSWLSAHTNGVYIGSSGSSDKTKINGCVTDTIFTAKQQTRTSYSNLFHIIYYDPVPNLFENQNGLIWHSFLPYSLWIFQMRVLFFLSVSITL